MAIRYSCQCGKAYELTDAYAGKRARCKLCGTVCIIPPAPGGAMPMPPSVASLPPPIPTQHTYSCPRCQSENFQSFPIIFESGTSSSHFSAVGIGVGSGNYHDATIYGGSGQTRSALANRVAPPSRADSTGAVLLLVFSVVLFMIVAVGGVFLYSIWRDAKTEHATEASLLCAVIFLAPCLVLGLFFFSKSQRDIAKAARFNESRWPRLYDEWERSFLCLRCGFDWTM